MTTKLRDAHELAGEQRTKILEEAIGRQLRKLRKENNLTAMDVSRATGVSVAMISKIENGQTSPSLSTLQSLAAGLNVSLASLLQQFEESRQASYVPAGQGVDIQRRGSRAGHQYRLLGHGVQGEVDIEPYLITLTDTSDVFPMFQHAGIEFIYMLSGELDYRHGENVYRLKPGDSLFFDPQAAHGPEKLVTLPIEFLSIISYAKSN